jgi:hypothetical protein
MDSGARPSRRLIAAVAALSWLDPPSMPDRNRECPIKRHAQLRCPSGGARHQTPNATVAIAAGHPCVPKFDGCICLTALRSASVPIACIPSARPFGQPI